MRSLAGVVGSPFSRPGGGLNASSAGPVADQTKVRAPLWPASQKSWSCRGDPSAHRAEHLGPPSRAWRSWGACGRRGQMEDERAAEAHPATLVWVSLSVWIGHERGHRRSPSG